MLNDTLNNNNSDSTETKEILKPSKVLLKWEAPERLFKKKSRQFYRRLAVIIIFFSLLAIVIKDIPMALILGVSFFAVYVFHTIPPRNVVHQITTRGVNYASEYLYTWDKLVDFWIEQKDGSNVLNMTTVDALPGRISLVLNESLDVAKVRKIVNEYLSINENPSTQGIDNLISKLSSKFSLD